MQAIPVAKAIDDNKQQAEKKKPFVSVVVPAYNEATIIDNNLTTLCEYMETLEDKHEWELIIVNDGSTDETGELAEAFAKNRENVRVLHHMYNFRLGQALRFAFNNCRGDYVVTMDADLSYSPDHIEKMLTKIRATKAKVVIASPYTKGGKLSNIPWLRKTLSIWANRFLSLTITRDRFSDRLTTLTGMVRAYDREFLSRLNLKAMDVDIMPEVIYKSMILRARIVEIPAHLNWNTDKVSGKHRRSSMRILKGIISSLLSGFLFRPFMFFILPGLALIAVSMYPIGWTFVHTFSHYQDHLSSAASPGHHFSDAVAAAYNQAPHAFFVGGICLIVALQLISLGLLALQNKKYFEEQFHLGSSIYKCNQDQ